ncbi:uncharacterized protein E0L32_001872 [Thyridium curvatum]|uniref:Mso1 N-terminal domain-containing protein n=1 Tax=Thyridium curvatum TaxID=1093900 RepID=A0A507AH14_9PEZI|nr:uncharacterized protein E0L32_001807 [Thyridium curvatum]XP_030990008.1 uncharacterized protein E0L32_001872 [Thyridium curvatum]TPX08232.1 hypothetical protein E0L32_001807 [Thyridium curvatum]TPX08297.1 hypothetical protein E0L32_001872 [Thyridium curvatum]
MTSWYSNILTTTSSRISNLRSTYLSGDADGDTEDDTHVCRVLRAYYTEKGRTFPGWLPPDPKAPPPAPAVYAQPQVGSRYGGMASQPGGGGGLSSLWDSNPASQRQDAQSLRQGRGAPMQQQQQQGGRLNPYARNSDPRDDNQTRPPPGQRAGSYQSANAYGRESSTTPPAGGGGSAQDRLRNRLFGGGGARTTSPQSGGPFQPPAQSSSGTYGSRGGQSGGGAADNYEDRFAPGGMYDAAPPNRGGGGGDRPFMAANSPWASNDTDYSGGGSSRPGGLPSGPRRPGGLPSGPRMR